LAVEGDFVSCFCEQVASVVVVVVVAGGAVVVAAVGEVVAARLPTLTSAMQATFPLSKHSFAFVR